MINYDNWVKDLCIECFAHCYFLNRGYNERNYEDAYNFLRENWSKICCWLVRVPTGAKDEFICNNSAFLVDLFEIKTKSIVRGF